MKPPCCDLSQIAQPARRANFSASLEGKGLMVHARKKILCIEDDREAAALIVEELADQGFEPIAAHDGQAGFDAILEHMPDLVLCDVNMSGFEVLERLHAFAPRFRRIPFVFLTAMADRDNELRGRHLGAHDYVVKPVDFKVLHTIINGRLAGPACDRTRA
jgi:DNA-binding response OmpR family regulator